MPRAHAMRLPGTVSPLARDLLRLAAPTDDIRIFRDLVHQIWGAYPENVIDLQLRALREQGCIRDAGAPRVGWLTDKGQTVLAIEQSHRHG